MTPQCTDCLGYHGQAKPCPAFGTTEDAAATGVTLAQWQDVCHRHNTLFLENESLRARLAEVEAERDAARDAGMESLADKISAGLNKYGYEEQEGDEPEEDVVRSIVALIEERAEASEAREKAKDERIQELREALALWVGMGFPPQWEAKLEHIQAKSAALLSTPSPSQPVKVAEEPCDRPEGHMGWLNCPDHNKEVETRLRLLGCPAAEKLTGTGEKPL